MFSDEVELGDGTRCHRVPASLTIDVEMLIAVWWLCVEPPLPTARQKLGVQSIPLVISGGWAMVSQDPES
ncbi:MAG TPA: hypothetical protein VHV57_06100 [Acidimicrobiales bacterium]|nr:hypothetical protein [Acidimicrobiales bacterium]